MFARGRSIKRCRWRRSGRTLALTGVSAFTLIEMMVVIALIGILSAMIIPEMRGSYNDALLRSTGRQLVNACGLASSRAVSLNQVHRLHFDFSKNRFFLERRTPKSALDFVEVKDLAGSEGELNERISIELRPDIQNPSSPPESQEGPAQSEEELPIPAARDVLTFYPDGTCDRAAVVLKDPDGFRLGLRLNPVTSRIHLLELPHE